MYDRHQGIGSYQRTKIVTSDPGKLVLLCYEGAISHLKMARKHFEAKEFEAKGKAVKKTVDILHELLQSLDYQKGGEVARSLGALYTYMIRRILSGDVNRDLKAFDEVIGLLGEMEEAWKEICNGTGKTTAPPNRAPVTPEKPGRAKAAVGAWRA